MEAGHVTEGARLREEGIRARWREKTGGTWSPKGILPVRSLPPPARQHILSLPELPQATSEKQPLSKCPPSEDTPWTLLLEVQQ